MLISRAESGRAKKTAAVAAKGRESLCQRDKDIQFRLAVRLTL